MSWSSDDDDYAQTEGRQTLKQSQKYRVSTTPKNIKYSNDEDSSAIYFLAGSKAVPETTFEKPNSELVRRSVALLKSK